MFKEVFLKNKSFAAVFLVLLVASMSVFSQNIDISGSLTTQAGYGLPNTHDNKGRALLGNSILETKLNSVMDESMVYVDSLLVYDSLNSQSYNSAEGVVNNDGSFALKIKEAYFDYSSSWWSLRAGRQIAAWGKADDIQITDILCPQDSSCLIAADYSESRMGIDALRLSLNGSQAQIDAYYIPFFTPATLPFAKKNPLHNYVFPDSVDDITITMPESINDFELPEKKLYNSEFALRLSAYFSMMDLSLYGFYGWDDEPFMAYTYDTSEITVSGEYKRLCMIGSDAAIPCGNFVFRFEAAFFPDRYIQTNDEYQAAKQDAGEEFDSAKKHHQVLALAGVDWDAGSGFTFTAQYVADYLYGSDDSIDELDRKRFEHKATLSIDKTLLNETLTLSASGALDLKDYSSVSEVSAEYGLSDSIKLSVIGDFYLEGPDDKKGMFGDYHDLCAVTVKGKISF